LLSRIPADWIAGDMQLLNESTQREEKNHSTFCII
jgi:hypothetical protein